MVVVLSGVQMELIRLREEVAALRKILQQAGYICAHCDKPISGAAYTDPYLKRRYHVICEGGRNVVQNT